MARYTFPRTAATDILHSGLKYNGKGRSFVSKMYIRTQFRRIIRFPRMMLWAFFMESLETKQMLHTYARYGRGKLLFFAKTNDPSPEELQRAKEQLKDIPRFLPFFVIVAVPAPGVTEGYALLAITLEKWLGHRISLLPSHFRSIFQKRPEPSGTDKE